MRSIILATYTYLTFAELSPLMLPAEKQEVNVNN